MSKGLQITLTDPNNGESSIIGNLPPGIYHNHDELFKAMIPQGFSHTPKKINCPKCRQSIPIRLDLDNYAVHMPRHCPGCGAKLMKGG